MKILEPYRVRIDALDDRIVDLLAERANIIREVAALKFRENIPAVLPDRVEEVRARAAARAGSRGLDPGFVRDLYTALIAYSCNLEEALMDSMAKVKTASL